MNSTQKREGSLPLLCRLGLHKWEDYGDEVQVFWNEPQLLAGTPSVRNDSDVDIKS